LVRVVAARFDLHRVRASRRDSMLRFAPGDLRRSAPNGDEVYWPRGVDPSGYEGARLPGEGEQREVDDVPYVELLNTMRGVVRDGFGVAREDALRHTANRFNVSRLGKNVRSRLEGVLAGGLAQEIL